MFIHMFTYIYIYICIYVPPKNVCKIFLNNKTIDKINLSRDPLVEIALLSTSTRFDPLWSII